MKPSLSRMVIVGFAANGVLNSFAPGVITRVWGDADTAHGTACVNVKLLPDGSEPFDVTSVLLFDTQEQAEASASSPVAFWPPRV